MLSNYMWGSVMNTDPRAGSTQLQLYTELGFDR